MTTTVALVDYRLLACHGAFDWEHKQQQPFIVSIWTELNSSNFNDKLQKTLDYSILQQVIDEVMITGESMRLMETLCEKMVDKLRIHNIISSIKIRIEKPDAPLPHPGGLALVEHSWTRD